MRIELGNPLAVSSDMEDGYIRIKVNGHIVGTIGEPAGPGDQSEFCVWEGDGMHPETDEEAEPIARIFSKNFEDVNAAWNEIVHRGHRIILQDYFGR